MTKIVNVESYHRATEEYVHVEVSVDMEAFGVATWEVTKVDGIETRVGPKWADEYFVERGIDPITYDQVDAAARLQLRGER